MVSVEERARKQPQCRSLKVVIIRLFFKLAKKLVENKPLVGGSRLRLSIGILPAKNTSFDINGATNSVFVHRTTRWRLIKLVTGKTKGGN